MNTKIQNLTPESIAEAKEILLGGGVVAIPTETVYGLGGSAFCDRAVQEIFRVKGRPADNPLIAHVHADYDLSKIIDFDPWYAKKLRQAFCPGPLTLVYPSTGKVSGYVSCGLNTLAVRIPAHAGAQTLLKEVDLPIVAPSANVSKHVSPTSARHVFDDFNGKIPLILDGGECVGGIESTVCDCTGEVPVILRPGLITREMIASVVGDCLEYQPTLKAGEKVKSPGVLYKHYAPRCKTSLFLSTEQEKAIAAVRAEQANGERVGVLCESEKVAAFIGCGVEVFDLGGTPSEMASRLYGLLRQAETACSVLIAVEPIEQGGVMVGVMNRLKKACQSQDIAH